MKPIGLAPGIRKNAAALALGALLLLATACSSSGGGGSAAGDPKAPSASSSADTVASTAVVTIAPGDGAGDVATTGTLKVAASGGKLSTVVVKDDKGTAVPGEISADGLGWTPTGHLDTSTRYTVDASAKDAAGRESDKHSTFTTVTPKDTFVGYFTPEDGSTVGVGMEVYLRFNRPITDKKAVEAGVKVSASPSVPVAARWNGSQELYIRPAAYWAAGTRVTLDLDLKGVEAAPGVYGKQRKSVHFTIGRRQVSIVDAAKHSMTVYRDNKAIRTIAISSGAPEHTTYNGKMVISEKYVTTRMNGDTVGFGGEYDIKDVPHAMRLTTSGTFIHGNYWAAPSVFGNSNTSHGCVGMHDVRGAGDATTPAAWFYNSSLLGDVVQVINSKDKTVQWYNGLNGWNLPWSQWTS
ncbi:L,D-transpeptidase [Actinacidiphila paucisporea]|uniref:Lipoprotein-anchoring transpeptidase ErfK/SrfK n=1 Tax=Actinacidiphila paucisporea TaxID=310782 RepID=A0A1M7QTI9_9ACTN|nr:Ig-like domain-containing protein [Actinacidiphila paucisporea]SHN35054.1 Lipoprotein-anchoring transpeptidase ErfK/SrfK [Actinacidiphila paucisporea]